MKFHKVFLVLAMSASGPSLADADLRECKGRNEFPNEWSDCTGTVNWGKGDEYVGEWKYGLEHGQGVRNWPDGSKYIGEWDAGYMHGTGAKTWSDGSRYEGDWENGKRDGLGVMTYGEGWNTEDKNGVWMEDSFQGTVAQIKRADELEAARQKAEREAEAKRQAEAEERRVKRIADEKAVEAAREARLKAEAEEARRIKQEEAIRNAQRRREQAEVARRRQEAWEAGAPERAAKKAIYDSCIIDLMPASDAPTSLQESVKSKCVRISENPSFFQRFKYGN